MFFPVDNQLSNVTLEFPVDSRCCLTIYRDSYGNIRDVVFRRKDVTTHEQGSKIRNASYHNYRSVSEVLVQRIANNAVLNTDEFIIPDVMRCYPGIHGTITLPGAFVLADGFEKSVSSENVDTTMLLNKLAARLNGEAANKLRELEEYRLYMTLMQVDATIATLGDHGHMLAEYLANEAFIFYNDDRAAVVCYGNAHYDLIATSGQRIQPGVIVESRSVVEKLNALIKPHCP